MDGQRLRQIRTARGMSLEELATALGGMVTRQALSKYERGRSQPSPRVLTRLATVLGVKAADLAQAPAYAVRFIAYRKRARLPKREQLRIESLVERALELRVRLQDLVAPGETLDLPLQSLPVTTPEDAEHAADIIRERWELGREPIANVVGLLEERRIHMIELALDRDAHFDGLAAVAESSDTGLLAAAIALRRGHSGERQRLSLAHELGHLVLDIAEGVDVEQAAFRFGSALLLPAEAATREIGVQRTHIALDELLILKRRFGISLQALLYRLRTLSILSEANYRQWLMELSRLGWRIHEPAELPPEQPQWLRRTLLRAVAEGFISQAEADTMRSETIANPAQLGRRAYMQLPLAERRRIMEEQAAQLADHYDRDVDWKDLPHDEIIDD